MKSSIKLILLWLAVGCSGGSAVPPNVVVTPNSFLASSAYTSLVIEVVAVSGFAPSATSLDNLKDFLQTRLNKPAGITVVHSTIASPGKSAYTLDNIKAIESVNRSQKTSGTTLSAFLLLVDGDYASNSGNSKVLGFAYGSS